MPDYGNTERSLSRRKLLALTLSGTAVGLAGCSGGDDTTTTSGGTGAGATSTGAGTATAGTTTSSSGTTAGGAGTSATSAGGTAAGMPGSNQNASQLSPDQMADSTLDMHMGWIPKNANWNHRSTGPATFFWPFDYTGKVYWNKAKDWWLLKEGGYSYDGDTNTVTYEFRPEYGYWWNGDPVTAKDYQIQLEIDRLIDPEGSPWKSWTLDDKYTLKGKRKKKINPILVGVASNTSRVFEYRNTWKQWLEKLQDDTTQEARSSTLKDLQNWKISMKQFANDGLGNGYLFSVLAITELAFQTLCS